MNDDLEAAFLVIREAFKKLVELGGDPEDVELAFILPEFKGYMLYVDFAKLDETEQDINEGTTTDKPTLQ